MKKQIPENSIKQKYRRNTCKKAKQYRNIKTCLLKMKQQLKNKKCKSN